MMGDSVLRFFPNMVSAGLKLYFRGVAPSARRDSYHVFEPLDNVSKLLGLCGQSLADDGELRV